MVPIIYAENETNFSHNGLGLLVDTIYCNVEEVRNGSYEAELAYPVFSLMYKEIKGNKWIKAKANDRYEPQLFRIYYISKPINGTITIKAEHISYLLKDNFIEALTYTGTCNGILNALNSSAAFTTGFTFYSDVTESKSFDFDLRNFWECVIGKDDSIISQFGTGIDIVRNNKKISLMKNGGQDNNVLIAYRKNLTGFTLEEDWTGCITKIYPYATKDDTRIILPEKYVNSQYISRDPSPRVTAIDFTNEFAEGETITTETLRQKAIKYFLDTQCDVPNLNYNIEFVALSKTEEYKNFALNESIALLDYVIVRHELYGIDTKIKVVKGKYDSLGEKYLKLELGIIKNTITNLINNTNKKIEDTKEELKEDIKEVTDATNNLKVVMEERDNEIELSITNETANRISAINLLDGKIALRVTRDEFNSEIDIIEGEISSKVSAGDFGSLITQHFNEIIQAINDATGTHSMTLNSNGVTISNGALTVVDSSGNTLMHFDDSKGILGTKDLSISNTEKGSSFYNTLAGMDEVYLPNLACGTLYINDKSVEQIVYDMLVEYNLIN